MASKYFGPIKWLGGIAIIAFAIALIFPVIGNALFSEALRRAVLINAVPFFAAFVGVLLLFILVIVLVAMRYNGKIPSRTYQSVEYVIMGGILFGVFCLFQPFSFVPYRYGFLLLLISTLSFILWSHVVGGNRKLDAALPPLSAKANIAGLIAGGLVIVVLMAAIISVNAPKPPYGVRERTYNSYSDERKAEVAVAATQEFNTVELPFMLIFNLFPAAVVFFVVREAFADRRETVLAAVPAVG
ncbi:MAG: hypothetical protein K8L97_16075 [Anaerolineae bacterium]|nr:hypothetical protein [Anaerolineae bacterium]